MCPRYLCCQSLRNLYTSASMWLKDCELFDLTVRTRRHQLSVWRSAVMRSINQRVRPIRTSRGRNAYASRDKVVLRSQPQPQAVVNGRIVTYRHFSLTLYAIRFSDSVRGMHPRDRDCEWISSPKISNRSLISSFLPYDFGAACRHSYSLTYFCNVTCIHLPRVMRCDYPLSLKQILNSHYRRHV